MLLYTLDIGFETERQILRTSLQFGAPIPDRIKNAPQLKPGLSIFITAFFDLDSERELPRPIPWTSILKYGEFYGFCNELMDDLLYHVRELDSANLKRLSQKEAT